MSNLADIVAVVCSGDRIRARYKGTFVRTLAETGNGRSKLTMLFYDFEVSFNFLKEFGWVPLVWSRNDWMFIFGLVWLVELDTGQYVERPIGGMTLLAKDPPTAQKRRKPQQTGQ